MSVKKVQQVRSDKWFKFLDLFVYAALAVVIVVLFIVFVFTKDTTPLKGINVYLNNEIIFVYSFKDDEYTINSPQNVEIISEDDSQLCIKIVSGKNYADYNDIVINKEEAWVNITAANCSTRKDCVYTPKITNSASLPITCNPHGLKILPFGYEKTVDGNLFQGA
jgi:hypothetical protein